MNNRKFKQNSIDSETMSMMLKKNNNNNNNNNYNDTKN